MLTVLKDLGRLYGELEGEVFGESASGMNDSTVRSRDRQLTADMERASIRLSELVELWLQRRDCVSLEEREQVRKLAEPIRLRASRLLGCCRGCLTALEARLSGLRGELCRVRNGERFLQSTRPPRANYPKFVDSHG